MQQDDDQNSVEEPISNKDDTTPSPMVINGQYIKDLSFEVPQAPNIFTSLPSSKPDIKINVDVKAQHVTGNTYEENVVQYKFWYSFLFMLMAIALISSVVRYFNLVNNYGTTPNIRGVMFPLVGLVLIILRTIFEGY